MTIEITDEMRAAFDAALPHDGRRVELGDDYLDACLAAVLAIVERDYRVEPRPTWEVVHLVGDDSDELTRCCGRVVEDLPSGHRFTHLRSHLTCRSTS